MSGISLVLKKSTQSTQNAENFRTLVSNCLEPENRVHFSSFLWNKVCSDQKIWERMINNYTDTLPEFSSEDPSEKPALQELIKFCIKEENLKTFRDFLVNLAISENNIIISQAIGLYVLKSLKSKRTARETQ